MLLFVFVLICTTHLHVPLSLVHFLNIPLPLPTFPDGCPIRSTSRPGLTNHSTSKPGGGVKKVTGVGGTTYEISV